MPSGPSLQTSNTPVQTEAPMHAQVGFPAQLGAISTQWWTWPPFDVSVTHTSDFGSQREQSETKPQSFAGTQDAQHSL